MDLQDFLWMDGYAAYVWSCYGLTVLVLILNVWAGRRQLREQIVHAERRTRIQQETQS
jgi:heme exporter protein CcmD